MDTISSLVGSHGNMKIGQGSVAKPDEAVRAAQIALVAAGYRVGTDGAFGPRTEQVVRQFQVQHHLGIDGEIGRETAKELDRPHDELVKDAVPLVHAASGFPHDDTASLIAYYGKPWQDSSLLVRVPLPFRMSYERTPLDHISFHKRAAPQLAAVLAKIWDVYGHDQAALDATHFTKFSGSYNYRAIRGSSRLSCHAFGAAGDWDAEDLPLGQPNPVRGGMPANVVAAFLEQGFFWGGNYTGRKDPMHFQAAHE